MADSVSKKEKEKKKARLKQEKEQKKQERKVNNNKGKDLDDMMAYIDENGNLSSTPPDPLRMLEINAADIELDISKLVSEPEELIKKGIVNNYNVDKGYGFITEAKTKQSIFFHKNALLTDVKERDTVTFEVVKTPKGLNAINVSVSK
jgi:cold shock CspA family protein